MTKIIISIVGIIIAIIGLTINVVLYKLNKNHTYKSQEEKSRSERITEVTKGYFQLSNSGRSSGIHALISTSITTLKNEDEAKEVISIITMRTHKNPLSNYKDAIEEVGILNFFKRINHKLFKANKIDEILNELRHSKR